MTNTIKVFISYSHKDESLRSELEGHLAFLSEYGDPIWHDRMITPGSEWANEIDVNLNTCNIILLLISADFLHSQYCYKIEFKRAMERHKAGEAVVIPIILRDVFWEFGELKGLQALPKDGKAVTSRHWDNKDAAFRNVAEGVRTVVDGMIVKPQIVISRVVAMPPQRIPVKLLNGNNSNKHLDELYLELGKIDYRQQRRAFKQFIDSGYQAGAFLIHGEPECGQRWLLNRFLRQVAGSGVGMPPYKFSFERKGGGRSLEDLWSNLGEWCGLTVSDSPSPQQIAEEIHALWETQTVILILRGLDQIEQEYIEKLTQDFWTPLAEKAKNKPYSHKNYCLLFLVDEHGYEWHFPFARQLDVAWKPTAPIEFERLTRFSDEELLNWMDVAVDILPANLTVNDLLEGSEGGLPELVLKRVCKLCGENWHRRESIWIMY